MRFRCPICKKPMKATTEKGEKNKYFPFCSRRCRLIDLGAWLNADYRIVSRPEPGKEIEDEADFSDYPDNQD